MVIKAKKKLFSRKTFIMFKKIIYLGMMMIMCLVIFIGCINRKFDLKDEKVFWSGSIEDNFEIDRVVVIMKKTTLYPELKLRNFRFKNGKGLEYIALRPIDELLEDNEYINNYRQMAVIYLNNTGKENVLLAIEELGKLDFIKYVGPEMIYTGDDD